MVKAPVGETFGRLTIQQEVFGSGRRKRTVECLCSCGTVKLLPLHAVLSGNTSSCGCLRREVLQEQIKKISHTTTGAWAADSPLRECPRCHGAKSVHAGFCRTCRGDLADERRSTNPNRWTDTRSGYVWVEVPRAYAGRQLKAYEHVLVMEKTLGRRLLPGENVHHKNGVRADNRPENLELWVVAQPSGQRPEDLIAWAHEILRRYDVDHR